MGIEIVCDDACTYVASMGVETIDLTVTSPPYDAIRDYADGNIVDLSLLGKELFRVTKDGGIACVVMGDGTKDFAKSLSTFRLAVDWCDNAGWRLFESCVYQRDGRPGAWWSQRFRVDHEHILIFLKGKRPRCFDKSHLAVPTKHPNAVWHGTQRLTDGTTVPIGPKAVNATKCRGTVWKYATSNSERKGVKSGHPATFPDALAADLIRCFSRSGDTVLDPMCGSGTTCVMADIYQRNTIGVDISQSYCDIARTRAAEAVAA